MSLDKAIDRLMNEKRDMVERLLKHNHALSRNIESVAYIKRNIVLGDLSSALEAWAELDEDDQIALWVAPSKGGIFTTEERKLIRS